jgi:hypothetical protein
MREYLMARAIAASFDTGETGGDLDDEVDIIHLDGASSRVFSSTPTVNPKPNTCGGRGATQTERARLPTSRRHQCPRCWMRTARATRTARAMRTALATQTRTASQKAATSRSWMTATRTWTKSTCRRGTHWQGAPLMPPMPPPARKSWKTLSTPQSPWVHGGR